MKKTLLIISFSALMVACNKQPDTSLSSINSASIKPADVSEFAEFQAWKTQRDLKAFDEYKKSKNTVANGRISASQKPSPNISGGGSASTTTSYPAKAPAKKGWSKAAKGAAIGAGSGAVIGAVINKRNRAVGAVIGGAAGGAVGYGIGRHMDKKDGR